MMGSNRKRGGAAGRMATPGYRSDIVEVLERLFSKQPEVSRGKMFGFPAFYTAGKLFACVYGEGVGLKLPEEVIRSLDDKPHITPFRPYGKPKMKEWIQIRHDRAEAYAEDTRLFLASIAFVSQTARRIRKPSVR